MLIERDKWIAADRRAFRAKHTRISEALSGKTGIIDGVTENNRESIFYMLLFCLCVPQSKAVKAEEAIDRLRTNQFYHNELNKSKIVDILTGLVRFQHTKAERLIEARRVFFSDDFWPTLVDFYSRYNSAADKGPVLESCRHWLMRMFNGMGMKLASHFLRNVGMRGLAILDVHVLTCMDKRGLISAADIKSLTKRKYEFISQRMQEYANSVGISLDELDLLFWSERTGFVFK